MTVQLDMFAEPARAEARPSPSGCPVYDAAVREFDARIRAGVRLRRAQREREWAEEDARLATEAAAFVGPMPAVPQCPNQRAIDWLLLEMRAGGEIGAGRLVHGFDAQFMFTEAEGRPFDPADTDALLGFMIKRGLIRMMAGCAPTPSQRCNTGAAYGRFCPQCSPDKRGGPGTTCLSWHYFARCR